jgi:hypothetical protein
MPRRWPEHWFVCLRRLIPRTRDCPLDTGKVLGRARGADIRGKVAQALLPVRYAQEASTFGTGSPSPDGLCHFKAIAGAGRGRNSLFAAKKALVSASAGA